MENHPGRADDRLPSCRAVCDAVDAVLADFGLQVPGTVEKRWEVFWGGILPV